MVRQLQMALIFLVMASFEGNERHRVGCAGEGITTSANMAGKNL